MYLVVINENLVLDATNMSLGVKFFEFPEDRRWSYACWNLKLFILVSSHKNLQQEKSRKSMEDGYGGRGEGVIRFKVGCLLYPIGRVDVVNLGSGRGVEKLTTFCGHH